ncbi:hypothetical protein ISCGN_009527 [Ixodes scapularis]
MGTTVQVLRPLVIAVLLAGICGVLGDIADGDVGPTPTADPEILEMEEGLQTLSEDIKRFAARQLLPVVNEILFDPRLSTECAGGLLKLGTALGSSDIWALQMLDSMGRPPPGILTGRMAEYGAYDQCMAIRHPQSLFQGKYCLIQLMGSGKLTPSAYKMADKFLEYLNFKHIGNISKFLQVDDSQDLQPIFKLGSCVPSVCRKEDLQFILNTVLSRYKIKLHVGWCRTEEPLALDRRQLAIIAIFGAWLLLLILGTGFDFHHNWTPKCDRVDQKKPRPQGFGSRLVLAFSLRRAFLKLIQVPDWGDYSDNLGFLNGMRVLSATWIILGHTYVLRDHLHNSNMLVFLKRIQNDFFFSVHMQFYMAVGTFLAITGFLAGYIAVKKPQPNIAVQTLIIIGLVRRYIRLVPSLLALLGVLYLIPLMASGPQQNETLFLSEKPCNVYWWKILTMTQNYADRSEDMCLPHFWYISVDFQLAIFRIIILVAIFPRWPKFCFGIMAAIVIATCAASGLVTYINSYMPFTVILTTDIKSLIDTSLHVYQKAFAHAPALFTGVIFGCLAARTHQLSRNIQAFMWTVSAISASASLFGVYTWSSGRAPEPLESAVYAGLHRFAWAFAVSWVMYACATGRGGLVNRMLAWPLFYPLARLSYAVYLVHYLLLAVNTVLSRERKTHQPFLHAQSTIGVIITSNALATLTFLCIECPFDGLDALLFGWVKAKPDTAKDAAKPTKDQELKSVSSEVGAVGKDALSAAVR